MKARRIEFKSGQIEWDNLFWKSEHDGKTAILIDAIWHLHSFVDYASASLVTMKPAHINN